MREQRVREQRVREQRVREQRVRTWLVRLTWRTSSKSVAFNRSIITTLISVCNTLEAAPGLDSWCYFV